VTPLSTSLSSPVYSVHSQACLYSILYSVLLKFSSTQVLYKKLMEPTSVDPYDDDEDLVWGETDTEKSCRRKRALLKRIEANGRKRHRASRIANATEAEHIAANLIQAWAKTANDLCRRGLQIRWESQNPDLPYYPVCLGFEHQACIYCYSCICNP
jgi:hypothetical protein